MPSLNGNWVDLIIIVVLIYFATEAWRHGVWVILAEFISFLGSLIISLRGYKYLSNLLAVNFNLPNSIANALGFLMTAVISEIILGYIFAYFISKLPKKFKNIKYNKVLAILPALGQGLILISFVLTLLLGMPIKAELKESIGESKIGGVLVKNTSAVEKNLDEVFGGVVNDSLTYLTVKPESHETLKLNSSKLNLKTDSESEAAMVILVNKERKDRGIAELTKDSKIADVARAYAKDMWTRQFFSHYSPEGKDVGDRLTTAGIRYYIAGENLALAPTLTLAHNGLMNSEGHKANILEKRYKKVGIGVIDNGYYGKIFVQVFTD
ncbi:CvpA family protein [Candidatus Microgenomates bacterium]|nr:CvpA family protein [Candidatus Microgenomates bacterium]